MAFNTSGNLIESNTNITIPTGSGLYNINGGPINSGIQTIPSQSQIGNIGTYPYLSQPNYSYTYPTVPDYIIRKIKNGFIVTKNNEEYFCATKEDIINLIK